ncbi:MAG: DUF2780 domain-containing protein [Methylococcales bacterium]|nr:DUF2780 domain-containing protein [Methylococcales bacterium]
MKKNILTLALALFLLTNAEASEWQDILKAANATASPKTKQTINNLLHNAPSQRKQGSQPIQINQLTEFLMQGAGVTKAQAQGGVGVLLKLAQSKLQAGEFAQLEQAIPNLHSLLNAVPALQQPSTLSSLAKLAGGSGGTVSNLLTIVSLFKQLGMSSAQIQQFVPLVLDYVNTEQGATVAKLLGSAIMGK